EAMWRMLQQDEPDDYVIGTGVAHAVENFVCCAFDHVGLNWHDFVIVDPQFYRPAEVDLLLGNANKAKARLGWSPKVGFEDLVRMMVDADLAMLTGASARAAARAA